MLRRTLPPPPGAFEAELSNPRWCIFFGYTTVEVEKSYAPDWDGLIPFINDGLLYNASARAWLELGSELLGIDVVRELNSPMLTHNSSVSKTVQLFLYLCLAQLVEECYLEEISFDGFLVERRLLGLSLLKNEAAGQLSH